MQKDWEIWCSLVDLNMSALGGPKNVQNIPQLSQSVLQNHWCNILASYSYSAKYFVHNLDLCMYTKSIMYPYRKEGS